MALPHPSPHPYWWTWWINTQDISNASWTRVPYMSINLNWQLVLRGITNPQILFDVFVNFVQANNVQAFADATDFVDWLRDDCLCSESQASLVTQALYAKLRPHEQPLVIVPPDSSSDSSSSSASTLPLPPIVSPIRTGPPTLART